MPEISTQSVLRCRECSKPFDKESSLQRHGYYCRSRKAGSTARRPRSCLSCARAKARCDSKHPQCERCLTKGIECRYPATGKISRQTFIGTDSSHESDRASQANSLSSTTADLSHMELEISSLAGSYSQGPSLDDALVIRVPGSEFATISKEHEFMSWDDSALDFPDFLDTEITDTPASTDSSSLVLHSTPATEVFTTTTGASHDSEGSGDRDHQNLIIPQTFLSRVFSIPRAPSTNVRSLALRPERQAGTKRISNLILHTLRSYPLMMLRHSTLPPFIHPGLISPEAEDSSMESLTNCVSLVRMISSGVQGSRKLFWKNVVFENERMYAEHRTFNKWELLAAMQALSVYILIRLDEGQTDHNNLDSLLMKTVSVLAQQLVRNDLDRASHIDTQCTFCNSGLEPRWKDWIYIESRRRMGVIFRIVNMVFYHEPSVDCTLPADLVLAPLSARKQLWEAKSEQEWRTESRKEPGLRTAFALAADGELVRLEEGRLSCTDTWLPDMSAAAQGKERNIADWGEWCAGMDGMGGLVMLAASMVG